MTRLNHPTSWGSLNLGTCGTHVSSMEMYEVFYSRGFHAGSLRAPRRHPMETVIEDQFIRKFMLGTWYKVWLSEVVIKRRHNDVVICGVVCPLPSLPAIHFLMGYTEELLSHLLKYNVKVEVQCVPSRRSVVHKYV